MGRRYCKTSMRVRTTFGFAFTKIHNADWSSLLGDQAEIIVTLIGEPPFTFTYQRSEVAPKKGGPGKVLETHTVSRVMSHEYSIFSAVEG